MKERPILFSAPMVRALLDGTKTQTRRVVKLTANGHVKEPGGHRRWHPGDPDARLACPYGQSGDRLWVRESFIHEPADYCWEASVSTPCQPAATVYRADAADPRGGCWKPSIHMPRSASRILLEIVSVRVERLNDISEDDARAEGITDGGCLNCGNNEPCGCADPGPDARDTFIRLWESIHGPGNWDANPWVWVVEFRKVTP